MFVALNHDLGKIGDLENDYYIETDEAWKNKRGIKFDINPAVYYMAIEDRSLYLLQHYNIRVTPREYVAIKIHDGLYQDGNKSYFMQWGERNELDRFIYIIHIADLLASKQEYEEWAKSIEGKAFLEGGSNLLRTKKGKKSLEKILSGDKLKNDDIKKIKINKFEDLFGDVFGEDKK